MYQTGKQYYEQGVILLLAMNDVTVYSTVSYSTIVNQESHLLPMCYLPLV